MTLTHEIELNVEPGSPRMTMRRAFAATPELLFRANTEAELIARWLGPRRLAIRIDEMDVRDGGRWAFTHIGPDGSEHAFRGVHHGTPSVADGITRTFEYLGAPGHVSLEKVTFVPDGDVTWLEGVVVFQDVESLDAHIAAGMEGGMRESYERLEELLPTLS